MKALVTTPASPTSLFVVRRLKELGYKVTVVDSHNRVLSRTPTQWINVYWHLSFGTIPRVLPKR